MTREIIDEGQVSNAHYITRTRLRKNVRRQYRVQTAYALHSHSRPLSSVQSFIDAEKLAKERGEARRGCGQAAADVHLAASLTQLKGLFEIVVSFKFFF